MSGTKKTIAVAGLVLMLGLGVFFRCYHIEKKVFWHDEIFTKMFTAGYQGQEWKQALFTGNVVAVEDLQGYLRFNSERTLANTLRGLAREDPHHPPLYYALGRMWLAWFGDSVVTLRLLSVFLSLLAFPAIYLLCRELFEARRVAWMAVALWAVSPFAVLYAQEAREYAFWTVLLLLTQWALLRALRVTEEVRSRRRRFFAWGVYSLLTVLELYTSFSSASVLLAQGIYVLIRERFRINSRSLSFAAASAVALLLFLPWAMVLKAHYKIFLASMAWATQTRMPRAEILQALGVNLSRLVVDFASWKDPYWLGGIVLGYLSLLLYAGYCLCRETPRNTSALILALIVVPIGFLLLPDLVGGGIRSISARYYTPSYLGMCLALSYLFAVPLARKKGGLLLVGLVFGLSVASCFSNSQMEATWTKGVSIGLPQVARTINGATRPLLVGNQITYNPGNLLALSYLLKPEVRLQLRSQEAGYVLPGGFSDVFLLNPSDRLRGNLESVGGIHFELVFKDLHLQLWRRVGEASGG